MPAKTATKKLSELEAENKRLKIENQKLQKTVMETKQQKGSGRFWQKTGAVVFGGFAVALLVTGNVLFWAGNTLVKNDRFVETVSPVIENQAVQTAIAGYTTQQIYANFDAQSYISEALPPRAEFLAPTLASQLESSTQGILNKILANPNFQEKWNTLLANAHNRFISSIQAHGSDGSFNINEVYQELSASLQSTPLSFLSNRQLPPKIGSIQVISAGWISTVYTVVDNIDLWRVLAILLFFATAALCIFLSKDRRRTLIRLSLIGSVALFITLISIRVSREIAANSVASTYSEAVRQTVQIIFHSLAVQIATLMATLLLIAFVAWMSGPGRSAQAVRLRANQLLSGKLHQAIFAAENGFTLWLGRHKRVIEWIAVALTALSVLVIQLTPGTLVVSVLILAAVILLVELLAAPQKK